MTLTGSDRNFTKNDGSDHKLTDRDRKLTGNIRKVLSDEFHFRLFFPSPGMLKTGNSIIYCQIEFHY